MITAAKALENYEKLVKGAGKRVTEKPHLATDIAHEIEASLATVQTLKWWEAEVEEITEYAEEKGWTAEHVVIVKLQALLRGALRGADDSWSGRGNDAKRVAHDARRETLSDIEFHIRGEIKNI